MGSPVAGIGPDYSLITHSDFRIGQLDPACTADYEGDLDEVMVWDAALSDAQVAALGDCSTIIDMDQETGDTSQWTMIVPMNP